MSFKHFKHRLASADTDVSLYTVPSGREFVLMKMRARNGGNAQDESFVYGTTFTITISGATFATGVNGTYQYNASNTFYEKQGDTSTHLYRYFDAPDYYYRITCNGLLLFIGPVTGGYPDILGQHAWQISEYYDIEGAPSGENLTVSVSGGSVSTNTMTFKTVEGGQTNTVGEISILSSEISRHGASIKRLMDAGSVIMARSSVSGMMAEAMGVEFNAGVWSTIHEWGGSSSSSEQASSSSEQGGGGQGNTDTLTISCSDSAVSGTYNKITNSSDAYYYNGTGYEKSGGGVWLYLDSGYWFLHVGEGMDRFCKDNCSSLNDILGTTNWWNEMAWTTESITVTTSGGESVIDGPYSVWVSNFGSGNYVKTSDTCNSHYVYHCSDNGRYLFVTYGEGTYQWAMNTSKIETVQGDMPMMLNCWSYDTYADATSVPGSPVGNYHSGPNSNYATVQLND